MSEPMTLEREAALRKTYGQCVIHAELFAEIDRLRAELDKLPKYADTGEPFVLGRDEAWIISSGKAFGVDRAIASQGWLFVYTRCDLPPDSCTSLTRYSLGPAYSTETAALAAHAAAEAAKENQ